MRLNGRSNARDPLSVPLALIMVIGVLVAWEYWANGSSSVSLLISSPSRIVAFIRKDAEHLTRAFAYTGFEAVCGLAIATAFSLMIAAIFFIAPRVAKITYPWLVGSQVVPFVALAPGIILIFGPTGPWGKIALSALVSFFPILTNITAAYRRISPDSLDLMMLLNAKRLQVLKHVIVPECLSGLFSGLRIAVPLCTIGAIIAQFNGAEVGTGKDIFIAAKRLEPELMMSSIASGALLTACIYCLVILIESMLGSWYWEK